MDFGGCHSQQSPSLQPPSKLGWLWAHLSKQSEQSPCYFYAFLYIYLNVLYTHTHTHTIEWIYYDLYSVQNEKIFKDYMKIGASLMVQWLKSYLAMQRTLVWSLVREDPISCEVTKSVCHNYWVHALQKGKPPQWETCALQLERSSSALQLEKAHVQQQRPSVAKNK